MAAIESFWGRAEYRDYRVDVTPFERTVRVWRDDLLLARSDRCLLVEETRHAPVLYFPADDVAVELFEPSAHHTVCPFKGQASYLSLAADGVRDDNLVWTYPEPFPEVGALAGYLSFYGDRVRIELDDPLGDDPRDVTTKRFPPWGDVRELIAMVDVQPDGNGAFVGTPHPYERDVVEGSQMLAQSVVAASKAAPTRRVSSARLIFTRAASVEQPLSFELEPTHEGRTFSTLNVRVSQAGRTCSTGILLLDQAEVPDLIRHQAPMPAVPGPHDCPPFDMWVTGRDVRVVDGAYPAMAGTTGPPEMHAWVRFREAPPEPYLHDALLAQFTGHLAISTALRPHEGFGESATHVTLSTAILAITVNFHRPASVTDWLLYSHQSVFAGRGLAHATGQVFTRQGDLAATFDVQAMVRGFATDPAASGIDPRRAL